MVNIWGIILFVYLVFELLPLSFFCLWPISNVLSGSLSAGSSSWVSDVTVLFLVRLFSDIYLRLCFHWHSSYYIGLCPKENREWGNADFVCVHAWVSSFALSSPGASPGTTSRTRSNTCRKKETFVLSLFPIFLFLFFFQPCVEDGYARFEEKPIKHECAPCSSTAKALLL